MPLPDLQRHMDHTIRLRAVQRRERVAADAAREE
jgi:hypothetical protein